MNNMITIDSINASPIRKEWHENEWYYCVIDIFCFLLNMNYKQAQNYYHVAKSRWISNKITLPKIIKLKTKAADNKLYYTDFTNYNGLNNIFLYIQNSALNREIRIINRADDEVVNFHPRVILHLQSIGLSIEHHVHLPSGKVIDILGIKNNDIYIIECKPNISKEKFYQVIGQIICYSTEYMDVYNTNVHKIIATFSGQRNNYYERICSVLDIQIFEINRDV